MSSPTHHSMVTTVLNQGSHYCLCFPSSVWSCLAVWINSSKMYFFFSFSPDTWRVIQHWEFIYALNLWATRPGKTVRERQNTDSYNMASLEQTQCTWKKYDKMIPFYFKWQFVWLFNLCLCFKTASVCCLVQQSACRCKLRSVISCLGTNASDRLAAN